MAKRPPCIDVKISEETLRKRAEWKTWRKSRGAAIPNSDDPTKDYVLKGTTLPSGRPAVRMTKVDDAKRRKIREEQR